jgi:formyl-CoA transferase/CoA:oxalate CoA-transferase
MILGDLGAEVIKIERPGVGDQSRRWGGRWQTLAGEPSESAYFVSTNRNKRSLTLNIQSPTGNAILHQLLATADVLLCNIPRRDSLRKIGLDPDEARAKYPRLIYAYISGYGLSGPNAGRSGYDLVAQGEAGLMSITGAAATAPIRYPVPLADMTTGLYAVIGILAALRARDVTGAGQVVEVSLREAQTAYLGIVAGDYFATGIAPPPVGNAHPSIVPYQVFRAADKDVIIAVGSEKQWAQFCAVLGLGPEVRDDARFATNPARLKHRAELVPMLEARLAQMPSATLLEHLQKAEIPCGPINTIPDSLSDAHYVERGNVLEQPHPAIGTVKSIANPIRLTATPVTYRLPAPRLGEHTEAILTELGYDGAAIAALRQVGEV